MMTSPRSPQRSARRTQVATPTSSFVSTIIYPILAGLLMHGPGLKVKFAYENGYQYSESLLGAAVEGVFLLLFASKTYHVYRYVHARLLSAGPSSKCQDDPSSPTPSRCIVIRLYEGCGILLSMSYFGFILTSICGDATFRLMSGNDSPSGEELRSGAGCGISCAIAPFRHEPLVAAWRLVFGIACVGGSLYVYAHSCKRQKLMRYDADDNDIENQSKYGKPIQPKSKGVLKLYILVSTLGFLTCMMSSREWYTPVVFSYLSIFVFESDDWGANVVVDVGNTNGISTEEEEAASTIKLGSFPNAPRVKPGAPNIIYIQHDSLSGSAMLDERGVKAMPFLHDKMQNDDNMYVFEHGRTGSGITLDAMPAMLTGCLPYTQEGTNWAHTRGRGIGYDFKVRGYKTASFSSVNIKDQQREMHDPMAGGLPKSRNWFNGEGSFDLVADPRSNEWPLTNGEGCDDRRMLPDFEQWLHALDDSDRSPFYAQFYSFNAHYPYVKDPKNEAQEHRYYDSLLTVDQFLQTLFEILEKTGRIEDTIIVGSGDHGEDPFWPDCIRLSALTSNVLHTGSYIYYPSNLMPDQSVGESLRHNTRRMTYTMDLYPTILSIINGGNTDYLYRDHFHEGCITGVDLTSVSIPDDRVTIHWNRYSQLVRSRNSNEVKIRFWALSTKDSTGRELSLYHRLHTSPKATLKQGRDNLYTLHQCSTDTMNTDPELCMAEVTGKDKDIFRDAISWIKNGGGVSFFNDGVKDSELVEFFSDMVLKNDKADEAAEAPTAIGTMQFKAWWTRVQPTLMVLALWYGASLFVFFRLVVSRGRVQRSMECETLVGKLLTRRFADLVMVLVVVVVVVAGTVRATNLIAEIIFD